MKCALYGISAAYVIIIGKSDSGNWREKCRVKICGVLVCMQCGSGVVVVGIGGAVWLCVLVM